MADHRFFEPYVYIAGRNENRSIGKLMDVPVPVNVAHLNVWTGHGKIEWRTRTGGRHEMEWPADGDIMPIIVAMRMSC